MTVHFPPRFERLAISASLSATMLQHLWGSGEKPFYLNGLPPVLKTGVRETVPWVRIPPLPPKNIDFIAFY
ncbi:hypothetical protein [Rhizobium sp. BK060]|uniref:hypothetical protein n=1 Tax=Rhizobium sp. BK060 TaxID=2587096 RepID=UPI001611C9D5|nr:hypothetical protein [Rhizobium sp. BK060]